MITHGNEYYFSKDYAIHIVDRVGGGDSFVAGIIYSIINNFNLQKTLDFAIVASKLKHSIEGDFNRVSVSKVEKLMTNTGNSRLQR